MMFDAMTLGSSHTDSMKKTWAEKGDVLLMRCTGSDVLPWLIWLRSNTYLEAILVAKLEDHVSSLSRRVGGIKHLK